MNATTLQRFLWTVTAVLATTGATVCLLGEPPQRTLGIGVQVAGLTLAVATYALQERQHAHRANTVVVQHVDRLEVEGMVRTSEPLTRRNQGEHRHG